MRVCPHIRVLGWFVILILPRIGAIGQSQTAADPIAVMNQVVTVTGWKPGSIPGDAAITGTVTRHFATGDVSTDLTLKLRNLTQYKFAESNNSNYVVVNGNAGAIVRSSGKARRLPVAAALSLRGFVLPVLSSLPNWSGPGVTVASVGQETIGGEICIGVRISPPPPANSRLATVQRELSPFSLWVSATTGLPKRIDFVRIAADNHYATIPSSVMFSDYRSVNGVAVAFHQDELIDGKSIITFQFSDVKFNVGLTDADFSVVSVLAGVQ